MSPIEEARKLCEEARLLRRSLADTIADFRTFRAALRAESEGRDRTPGRGGGLAAAPAPGSAMVPSR